MFALLLVHLRFVLLPFSTLCSGRHPQLARRQLPLLFLFDKSSICLWQLLNFLCARNVWLAFGVGLFLTAQTHQGRFEILMVVGM